MFRSLAIVLLFATSAMAGPCGDMDGNGSVTVSDGVTVLRMAAGLPATAQCALVSNPTPTPTAHPTVVATPIVTPPIAFLLGTWNFHFTIISSFTDTYRFQQLTTSTTGKPIVTGLNQYGGPAIGARIQDLSPGSSLPYTFEVLDNQAGVLCDYHLFDRVNDNSVVGDTFIMLTDAGGNCNPDTLSNPYAMTGQKISANAYQLGIERFGFALDAAVSARMEALSAEAEALNQIAPRSSDLEAIRDELRTLLHATR